MNTVNRYVHLYCIVYYILYMDMGMYIHVHVHSRTRPLKANPHDTISLAIAFQFAHFFFFFISLIYCLVSYKRNFLYLSPNTILCCLCAHNMPEIMYTCIVLSHRNLCTCQMHSYKIEYLLLPNSRRQIIIINHFALETLF